ncbi:hypothetical protein GCM10007977_086390 [Dactylosporangium sucinum]|uniref:Uncharacterized protein n=1 Tax=Dactylosporangium sucinum TaxID=1424081 RepID=A0A917UAQ1_9ACTN|nr:hypothetical protein GCM10007977_086390 [Dactylosporangium sucinum]
MSRPPRWATQDAQLYGWRRWNVSALRDAAISVPDLVWTLHCRSLPSCGRCRMGWHVAAL